MRIKIGLFLSPLESLKFCWNLHTVEPSCATTPRNWWPPPFFRGEPRKRPWPLLGPIRLEIVYCFLTSGKQPLHIIRSHYARKLGNERPYKPEMTITVVLTLEIFISDIRILCILGNSDILRWTSHHWFSTTLFCWKLHWEVLKSTRTNKCVLEGYFTEFWVYGCIMMLKNCMPQRVLQIIHFLISVCCKLDPASCDTENTYLASLSALPSSSGDEYHLVHISPDDLTDVHSDNSPTTPPPIVMNRKKSSPTGSNSSRELENSPTGSAGKYSLHILLPFSCGILHSGMQPNVLACTPESAIFFAETL